MHAAGLRRGANHLRAPVAQARADAELVLDADRSV